MDDVIIFSQNFEQHIAHLTEVFRRFRTAKLTIQPNKTHLFKKSVVFLGIRISAEGVHTEEANIEKVKNFPLQNTQKSVRGFLGLSGFYKKYIKNYSILAAPLFELTKKYKGKFKLTNEAIQSFKILQEKLVNAPLLTFPKLGPEDPPLTLTIDSSSLGVGFILSQMSFSEETQKLIDKPIFYGSKNFNASQRKLGSTELETLGITIAVKKLETYLKGRTFNLVTDHKAVIYIMNKKLDELKPTLARRVLYLSQFDFKISHIEGKKLANADVLSRQIYPENKDDEQEDNEPDLFAIQQKILTKPALDLADIDIQTMTESNIKSGQMRDTFFRAMYKYLKTDTLPHDSKMKNRIENQQNVYIIHNKLLYHIWNEKQTETLHQQICISVEFRTQLMQALHDMKYTGHSGTKKMYNSALRRFWWPGMYTSFENYVASCPTCLQANKGHYPRIFLKPLPIPNCVFETIHLDLLSISTPSNGYKYMLVIIDGFSKFIAVKCLKTKHAFSVAKGIFSEWFMRFGIPQHMCYAVHDNGLELVNRWTDALYSILNVKSKRTSVYKPSSNSQVEITNKYILSVLRKLTKDEPRKWSSLIPHVVMAINSSVSETTKYSPFHLTFGVPVRDIVDLQLPFIPDNIATNKTQAYTYWSNNLEKIRKCAKENIAIAKTKQKKYYDQHARPHSFKIGDFVYKKVEKWDEHDDTKLKNHYKGKYKIIEFLSDTNAILEDENGKKLPRSVYINKLKKCEIRHENNPAHIPPEHTESDSDTEIENEASISLPNSKHNNTSNIEDIETDNLRNRDQIADHNTKVPTKHDDTNDKNVPDNIPTEDFFHEEINNTQYRPINKIYRKRILPDKSVQYYVSFKNHPSKKDRTWVNESDMTPELQKYAKNRKLQITKANINMLTAE